MRSTPEARFQAKTERFGACLLWTGCRLPTGYGRFALNGETVYAHRYAYESIYGPIPKGLELDHLCRNRSCVEVTHLEPVAHQTNMKRGRWGAKTHCSHGHPFDEANTYWYRGRRMCRACKDPNRRQPA